MTKTIKFTIVVATMFLVGGCAVKQKYSIDSVVPDLGLTGKVTVAVAAQDQRDYVLSGNNKPQLVGIMRGGFGNPFYMTTKSGRPLADEMGDVIANALKKNGFNTITVVVAATESAEQVGKKLVDTGADKLIHFEIIKWQSDTFWNIRFIYSLHVSVYDGNYKLLAKDSCEGDKNLGDAGFSITANTRKKVQETLKAELERLFNSSEIVTALEL